MTTIILSSLLLISIILLLISYKNKLNTDINRDIPIDVVLKYEKQIKESEERRIQDGEEYLNTMIFLESIHHFGDSNLNIVRYFSDVCKIKYKKMNKTFSPSFDNKGNILVELINDEDMSRRKIKHTLADFIIMNIDAAHYYNPETCLKTKDMISNIKRR